MFGESSFIGHRIPSQAYFVGLFGETKPLNCIEQPEALIDRLAGEKAISKTPKSQALTDRLLFGETSYIKQPHALIDRLFGKRQATSNSPQPIPIRLFGETTSYIKHLKT